MRKSLSFPHNRFILMLCGIALLSFSVLAQPVKISFRPQGSAAPAGFTADNGLPFTAARKYGWIDPTTKAPKDLTANMRLRTGTANPELLSLVQMSEIGTQIGGTWEYALANGLYRVTVSAGDNTYFDSNNQINVEGLPAVSDFTPSSQNKFKGATVTVQVSDGKLTVDANGGNNSKMNYISIVSATAVTDAVAPTASARLEGTQESASVYSNSVKVYITGSDAGGSGLRTLQYAINDGSYVNFTVPFNITTPGNYSLKVKSTDANNNQKISSAYSFSVAGTVASSGAYMVLKNLDNFPADDKLVFSLIQIPWRRTNPTTAYNANHDRVKLRINSKGADRLTISNLILSNTSAWKIVSINTDTTLALPVQVNSGAFADVTIQFRAKDAASRVKVFHDTLTIRSNDAGFPTKKVVLNGLYQYSGEGNHEPYGQEIIDAFGFKSSTGFAKDDGSINGSSIVPNSSEVNASYFVRADNSKPVTVIQMAAYHGCCSATETFKYFAKGSSTVTNVFTHLNLDGQSLLPRLKNPTTSLAQGTFVPSGSFGLQAAGITSDRTKNAGGLIGLRFLKVYDANGNIVPNAYLVNMDYIGNASVTNYDYQDNMYYVENIKPETGTVNYSLLASVNSSDVNFNPASVGGSVSSNVTLKNQGTTYSSGPADPAIQLKSATISGPDASEFSVSAFSTTNLAAQATTPITVKFTPKSIGIKNAVLLVNYNNSQSPLRIPLYGIANNSTTTVSIFKRIKGAADANVTIGGNVYEADNNYRKGSIKLDKQVTASGIGGTDIDVLYQTYLSAATDLAETRYEIPLANGNYRIRMHLVENFFSGAGLRVFNATLENQLVINNLDIFKEVGYRFAYVKDFSAVISDGVLNINFDPSANRVAIAAVEIYKVTNNNVRTGGEEEDSLAVESLIASELLKSEIQKEDILVYPNPSQGKNVRLEANNLNKNEEVTVSVIPVSTGWGIRHTQKAFTDNAGSVKIPLNPSNNLQTGIYVITVESGSKIVRTKLLIE
ncbi:malectin domain-containing carbohydrate-binding protein [Dyadobacter sp. NIV53]|uniref:malectin domain-containing carbohydrate-binding protein n=1 Tax=Dyadobacter sp. NIV53 TaxID=2861765 RepID=UPI001C858187|nr:malectin domain-containing carbohydrate-binding protein [Dyadobacter sp. NIV53]